MVYANDAFAFTFPFVQATSEHCDTHPTAESKEEVSLSAHIHVPGGSTCCWRGTGRSSPGYSTGAGAEQARSRH